MHFESYMYTKIELEKKKEKKAKHRNNLYASSSSYVKLIFLYFCPLKFLKIFSESYDVNGDDENIKLSFF